MRRTQLPQRWTGRRLLLCDTVDELVLDCVTTVRELFSADAAGLLLVSPDGAKCRGGAIALKSEPFPVAVTEFRLDRGPLRKLVDRTPESLNLPLLEDELVDSLTRSSQLSFLGVSLGMRDIPFGVLFVVAPAEARRFTSAEEHQLELLGARVTTAYKSLKLRQEVTQANDRFRTLFQSAHECLFLLDPSWTIREVNPACEAILGWSGSGWIGRHLGGVVCAQDWKDTEEIVRRATSGESIPPLKIRVLTSEGSYRILDTSFSARRELGRVIEITCVGRDVTHQDRLEQELRQAQKMDALGRLAGGVAHDFNNMLSIIIGYAERIKRRGPSASTEEISRALDKILGSAQMASNLTRQLLSFSRGDKAEGRLLDVGELLGQLEDMLRRLIGEDLDLEVVTEGGRFHVFADPSQIQQMLFNLAANARDAMPNGGRLKIEVRSVTLDQANRSQKAGEYVVIEVSDTGIGMSDETKQHLFEPFFTTKEPGKGTGLGLVSIYGFVKQSGGFITVESTLDCGTTFEVYLPKRQPAPVSESETCLVPKKPQSHAPQETILVVEDDEDVRVLMREILQGSGYSVIEARNGVEALNQGAQEGRRIDLVLSDIVMPAMSGGALVERFRSERPDVRVVFTSGYTREAMARQGIENDGFPLLQKPFTADSLLKIVRHALDDPNE